LTVSVCFCLAAGVPRKGSSIFTERDRGENESPSNATALIKIDDGEIARGQFDECRYSFNYRSRIARGDDPRWKYIFMDAQMSLCGTILFKHLQLAHLKSEYYFWIFWSHRIWIL